MNRTATPTLIRLLRNPRVVFGALVLLALVLCALFAPWLAPHDPLEQDFLAPLQAPFWSAQAMPPETGKAPYWLGTDSLGRDVLSRLLWGTRTAVIVALTATLLAALTGTVLGALAGYFDGRVDSLISRLVDVWMAFPPVLLAVVLVALIGTGLTSVIIAIAVVDWTRFARVVRAETRAQRELDYITSARMLGASPLRILYSEILPNVAPLLITLITLEMGIAVVVEAILSFVGLSVASGASTWGGMLGEGRLYVNQAPSLMVLPIAATMITVLGLNALGDGLRQELDPVVRT